MTYYSQTIDLRGSEPSCKEQHAAFAVEDARVRALAEKLGPVVAECHKLHGEYASAFSAADAQAKANAQCRSLHANWLPAKAAYDAYILQKAACEKLNFTIHEYEDLARKAKLANERKQAIYEAAVAKNKSDNYTIAMANASANGSYNGALTTWKIRNDAYLAYRSAVSGQSYGLSQQWAQKVRENPSLSKYQWNHRTSRCDSTMFCQTKAWHEANALKCNPVRGLGEIVLPVADTCKVWWNVPYCPDACPTNYAAHPGPLPVAPTLKAPIPPPEPPVFQNIPTLEQYLTARGVPKATCPPPTSVQNPGSKPSCNPDIRIPAVPQKPTCTPPDMPAAPVKPTCQPGFFEQVSGMWLLLAAGGVGVYLYARK